MGYKCAVCATNEVEIEGTICELCAIGIDPYATVLGGQQATQHGQAVQPAVQGSPDGGQGGGTGRSRRLLLHGSAANTDPYGNDITPTNGHNPVQVYQPGQVPGGRAARGMAPPPGAVGAAQAQGGRALTAGIIKNVTTDAVQKPFISKWLRALFSGVPFSMDNSVTSFQVFPDYTGTTVNASGNACDQVVVYGQVTGGMVNDHNEVEVYGKRDAHGVIIAKTIRNIASGTTVSADRALSAAAVRLITLLAAALLGGGLYALGLAASGSAGAIGPYIGGVALILGLIALGCLFLKLGPRYSKWFLICLLSAVGVALYLFFPQVFSQLVMVGVTAAVGLFLIRILIKKFK